jgi:hypothetical protein
MQTFFVSTFVSSPMGFNSPAIAAKPTNNDNTNSATRLDIVTPSEILTFSASTRGRGARLPP